MTEDRGRAEGARALLETCGLATAWPRRGRRSRRLCDGKVTHEHIYWDQAEHPRPGRRPRPRRPPGHRRRAGARDARPRAAAQPPHPGVGAGRGGLTAGGAGVRPRAARRARAQPDAEDARARELALEALAQPPPGAVVERCDIAGSRALAAEERPPEVVEVGEVHRDLDRSGLDGDQAGRAEHGPEALGVGVGEPPRLVELGRGRIEGHGRPPEGPEHAHLAGVVPHVAGHHPAGPERAAIRAREAAGSARKFSTSPETTASALAPRRSRASTSPTSNRARRSTTLARARAICSGEGSTPVTPAGSPAASTSAVREPVPQPTSIHQPPGATPSHRTNCAATGRLQRPM